MFLKRNFRYSKCVNVTWWEMISPTCPLLHLNSIHRTYRALTGLQVQLGGWYLGWETTEAPLRHSSCSGVRKPMKFSWGCDEQLEIAHPRMPLLFHERNVGIYLSRKSFPIYWFQKVYWLKWDLLEELFSTLWILYCDLILINEQFRLCWS